MRRALMKAAAALALLVGVSLSRGKRKDPDPTLGPMSGPVVRTVLKHPWLTLGALAAFAATTGLIVVASGIVPLRASSGHWKITAAVLDFAKVRSVTTYSIGIRPPLPLDDPALVQIGRAHV